MIFQPIGGSGSGEGLTAKSGRFATSYSTREEQLGFEAKACIVAFEKSADITGFMAAGDRIEISAESGSRIAEVSLSSDGTTLSADYHGNANGILYLALG